MNAATSEVSQLPVFNSAIAHFSHRTEPRSPDGSPAVGLSTHPAGERRNTILRQLAHAAYQRHARKIESGGRSPTFATVRKMARESARNGDLILGRFQGVSDDLKRLAMTAESGQALDLIYDFHKSTYSDRVMRSHFNPLRICANEYFIGGMAISSSVADRHDIVVQTLKHTIVDRLSVNPHGEIRMQSLACGVARATFDAVSQILSEYSEAKFSIRLVDGNQRALDEAMFLASTYGFSDNVNIVSFCQMFRNVDDIMSSCASFQPHSIEMVGLVDYLTDKEALGYFKAIQDALPQNGFFISANVSTRTPQSEIDFLKFVMGWYMEYRSKDRFGEILRSSGFDTLTVGEAKQGCFHVSLARKDHGRSW